MVQEKTRAKSARFQVYDERVATHKLLFVTSGRDSADDVLRRKLLREERQNKTKQLV